MLTKQEAIKLFETKFWETMTNEEKAKFQLFEPLLCMPFAVFHEAVESTLKRPVYTHEFAFMDGLQKELMGEKPAPTIDEILNLIPADKRIVIQVKEGE